MSERRIVILGGGPAGIAAADFLAAEGRAPILLDRESMPGGLCRTLSFKGFLFDIGGHRFLTPYDEIRKIWLDIMGDEMLHVRRMSRIYYQNRFFKYPLSTFNALGNLGVFESFRCMVSFVVFHLFPMKGDSFESWMSNRFGKRLYEIFFKTYSEKLWGIPCKSLSSEWADQRIEGLSLWVAIKRALFGNWGKGPKTLTEEFLYPRTGPGEFYRRYQARAEKAGAEFKLGQSVTRIRHENGRVVSVVSKTGPNSAELETPAEGLISSLALPAMIEMLDPPAPPEVREAAKKLRFRNYMVVNVILDRENLFPDQWIYVQSATVRLARIQNYKNWSPDMVPDSKMTSLGLEYFSSSDESFWTLPDAEVIAWALADLERIGVVAQTELKDAFVVRQKNAYPIYEIGYRKNLDIVRQFLAGIPNLQTTGRAGLFRYCNSDLAMKTGLHAAKNLLGQGPLDLWSIS